jgi:cell division protease FtsH
VVPNPDVGGREKILKVHMRKVLLAPTSTPAYWRAARRASPAPISPTWSTRPRCAPPAPASAWSLMADFEYAKDKVLMGTERRSMAMTDEEEAHCLP